MAQNYPRGHTKKKKSFESACCHHSSDASDFEMKVMESSCLGLFFLPIESKWQKWLCFTKCGQFKTTWHSRWQKDWTLPHWRCFVIRIYRNVGGYDSTMHLTRGFKLCRQCNKLKTGDFQTSLRVFLKKRKNSNSIFGRICLLYILLSNTWGT